MQAATLQVLSRGRLVLGVAVGGIPSCPGATIGAGMRPAKVLIGAGAVAALAARRARAAGWRPRRAARDVDELREELRRELDRLAGADIKASRSRREGAPPPG